MSTFSISSSDPSTSAAGSTSAIVKTKKKPPSDRIAATNCCSSFFYNIPRSSIMITVPGFTILAIGAILLSTTHPDQSWTDGMDDILLISFVFLILGGAWTLGGIIYWVVLWCKYRPKTMPKSRPQVNGSRPAATSRLSTVQEQMSTSNDLELVSVVRLSSQADRPSSLT